MTLRQVDLVFAGDRQRIEQEQALLYYQAYMSGLFSQQYAKGKFPKYGDFAPWKKPPKRSEIPDYDKKLERMMKIFTQSVGGSVH